MANHKRRCMLFWSRVGARTGTLKNPTKCLWRWEPDRRSYFFFSPPAHLCAVTYMTEISLIVTLNKQFNSTQGVCYYCFISNYSNCSFCNFEVNTLREKNKTFTELLNYYFIINKMHNHGDFSCKRSVKHVVASCTSTFLNFFYILF